MNFWFLCIGQIEASTCPSPPGQPPGHLTFLKIIVQIPPYLGQKNDRSMAETPSVVKQNLYKYNKN